MYNLFSMTSHDATISRDARCFGGVRTPATSRGFMSVSLHEYAIQENAWAKLDTEAPLTG
jgi:hypothetical protein